MVQAMSAVNRQPKPSAMMMTRNTGAVAFGAAPKTAQARTANTSSSITLIALIALGAAAAVAALYGIVSYFRGGSKDEANQPAAA